MSHLIVGCGYLGRRVASRWLEQGQHVVALTRGRSDELRGAGIEPIVGDVLDPASLLRLPRASTLLYAVGLDRSSGKSFRDVCIGGLSNVLDHVPMPERFIYISSTSVYGQSNGEEVDETSSAEPVEENGAIIREAERMLERRAPGAVVLRFAGIYGPGRIIRRAAIEKGEPLIGNADKWLNLIHVEDGARAILAAEQNGKAGETYLVADGQPVQRRDFYTFMAEWLAAPPARFEPLPEGMPSPPHERGNRRISNRRMIEELGVELKFADYRSGLRAAIQ